MVLAAAAAPRLLTICSELHLGGHGAAYAALSFSIF
jgi:hypothetical protein